MAVRSRRLFGPTSLPTTPGILYTVPAGRTAILRSCRLTNRLLTNEPFALFVNGTLTSTAVFLGTIPGQTSVEAFDELVLNPGDVLRGSTVLANAGVAIGSGSLLLGEPE